MYRVGLETILGFTKVGDTLRLTPRVPAAWSGFEITYRFGTSTYEIAVRAPAGIQVAGPIVTVDGTVAADDIISLVDDGRRHVVTVEAHPKG
jgi:cellobiose phosphorylase